MNKQKNKKAQNSIKEKKAQKLVADYKKLRDENKTDTFSTFLNKNKELLLPFALSDDKITAKSFSDVSNATRTQLFNYLENLKIAARHSEESPPNKAKNILLEMIRIMYSKSASIVDPYFVEVICRDIIYLDILADKDVDNFQEDLKAFITFFEAIIAATTKIQENGEK